MLSRFYRSAAGLVLTTAATFAFAVPTYVATPISTFIPSGSVESSGISANGHVTGNTSVPGFHVHAFIFADGTLRDLGTLGGLDSWGSSINARGQVAGQARNPDGVIRGFFYMDGAMVEFGEPNSLSSAEGVNASGLVVGYMGVSPGTVRGFAYFGGATVLLPTLGGVDTRALAVNDNGQITGYGSLNSTQGGRYEHPRHAFRYANGSMADLGTLGGTNSVGNAINADGVVTGASDLVVGQDLQRAFVYSGAQMVDIGVGAPGNSVGTGINGSGTVVGAADTNAKFQSKSLPITHAFIYYDGVMYDLNLLVSGLDGFVLPYAGAINDQGQIAAGAYRLDPVGTAIFPPTSFAVEFHNATLDHYFMSIDPGEIQELDAGVNKGWIRTGETFAVYAAPATGMVPVCRFYIPPVHGDSHFFSASASECADVLAKTQTDSSYSGFVLESSTAFYLALPDKTFGACPLGTLPVYRFWNTRADSNHRYTTEESVRAEMKGKGYVPEGYGDDIVAMCAPRPAANGSPQ